MDCSLQAPLSMGFPRQENWSVQPFKGSSPHKDQTWVSWTAGGFFTTEPPGKPFLTIESEIEVVSDSL